MTYPAGAGGDLGRSRAELFPLSAPPSNLAVVDVGRKLSRRCAQRVARRSRVFERNSQIVSVLNDMMGFANSTVESATPNVAQQSALLRIHNAAAERPPPPNQCSSKAALRELLQLGPSYSARPGAVCPYQRDLLSIPRDQAGAVRLSDVLDPALADDVSRFEERLLLSPEERAAISEDPIDPGCYMDQSWSTMLVRMQILFLTYSVVACYLLPPIRAA